MSKSLQWYKLKYNDLYYKLPKVVDYQSGFSFLGYANDSGTTNVELNTGALNVNRWVVTICTQFLPLGPSNNLR